MTQSHAFFISCSSEEFRSYRDDLREALTGTARDIRIQRDFKVHGGKLLELLDTHISRCRGVIHLVGDVGGAKPTRAEVRAILDRYPSLPIVLKDIAHDINEHCPFTYTQWEAYLAIFHSVPCFVYLADAGSRREASCIASSEDKASQAAHIARLKLLGQNRADRIFDDARRVAIDFLNEVFADLQGTLIWTSEYGADLIKRASTLSFGDPASWTATGSVESEGLITLDQIWTPLRVADSQTRVGKVGTHENMAEKDQGIGLRELFESTDQSLLLLGDPGSGKSTSLAWFALDAARKWLDDRSKPLPIWVNLATIVAGKGFDAKQLLLGGVPEVEIAITRGGLERGREVKQFLSNAIVSGKALLLLDGLDEANDMLLGDVRRAISEVCRMKNGTRVITTCRSFDYRLSTPNRKVAIERELELLPYNIPEQKFYVEGWYKAAVTVGRFTPAQANELSSALVNELRNEAVAELAESPLLLALLTLIHSEEAKLPDTRAVVCDRAITYMLADSAKWRRREAGSATIATPPLLALAIELAYRCHTAEETAPDGKYTGVTTDLLNEVSSKICGILADADPTKNLPSPTELATRFLKNHGLVLELGNGRYKFSHRSFQEFLAGQYYAAGAHQPEALLRGASGHWREPFRLMASLSGHEGNNIFYILSLIKELLGVEGPASVPSIQLAAEMLTEIGRRRIALRQFGNVLLENANDGATQGLWAQARTLVSKQVENPSLKLPERARSGVVLGLLGDPRLIPTTGLSGPWANLIDIPAGVATIGSHRLDANVLKTSGGFLGGVRRVEFGALKLGRYPVTNAEFRLFVDDDGYTNPAYWKGKFARGWMSGDSEILKTIRDHWLSTVHHHHAKEIRDGEIEVSALEEEATSRTKPRHTPYYWLDRRFNQPNQPVVGINWWEAAAFCEWATQSGHHTGNLPSDQVIVLPTEFEWEFASRPEPDDRLFPWGDTWSEERAHISTNILNMRQPSPVGIYLEPWPGGPCDLAGNVWEWTANLFLPYSPEFDSQRLSNDSFEERVVRGSSWYNSSLVAACSARAVDRSYNLFYDVGFRVASMCRDAVRVCCQ